MGDVGVCWDNVVVECFFGSLKYDWLFKVNQLICVYMKQDVMVYMKYYNQDCLYFMNGDLLLVDYEKLVN